jgi:RNA polymerase sigma factor (sigma-70 family)
MGKEERFADCVVQHLPYLRRLVRCQTRDDAMTDDIVQETMLKALVHADEFRFESTVKIWLISIAKNELRQLYRCKWRTCSVQLMTGDLERTIASGRLYAPELSSGGARRAYPAGCFPAVRILSIRGGIV